jgi:pyrroline-5-carboxylate reductase
MRIGFAGAGNMGAAMARGWSAGDGGPDAMLFCDIDAERAAAVADEVGGETRETLPALAADADVLVLTVKPAALGEVAAELDGAAPPLVSILGGVKLGQVQEAFPGVPALRLMPNLPVEARRGVICHTPPDGLPNVLSKDFLGLLAELGAVFELDEELFEAAMAVMSCSPAYLALIAEALATEGEREGLDPQLSHDLVTGALDGTAELLRMRPPHEVRSAVASPGGATEQGLEALERGGLRKTIQDAVHASMERFR